MTAVVVYGDALALPLPDASVDLVVTSPPYWALRTYTDGGQCYPGQIGAEATPREFIAALLAATREMTRVLTPTGSIFVNLGDTYATSTRGPDGSSSGLSNGAQFRVGAGRSWRAAGVPRKSLLLLPERYRIACVDNLGLTARLILGWSPAGICTACGRGRTPVCADTYVKVGNHQPQRTAANPDNNLRSFSAKGRGHVRRHLTGDACDCPSSTAPTQRAVGGDPFGGTGTTALVASTLGRIGISVDRSADYGRLARWRTGDPAQRARAAGRGRPSCTAVRRPDRPAGRVSRARPSRAGRGVVPAPLAGQGVVMRPVSGIRTAGRLRLTVAVVATTAALAAGCGRHTGDSPPAPPPPPAVGPSPAVSLSAPAAAPAGPDLQQVAVRYLAVRENAISFTHPTPRSWLTDVRPLMTPAGYQQLAGFLGDGGGSPSATAHTRRWSVQASSSCRHDPDAGPATSTTSMLTCAVTDRTVDPTGRPVPTLALPALWPYTGPQPPAILAMRQVHGRWLVEADQSGRAG